MAITFNQPMNGPSVLAAASLTATQDPNGNPISSPVPFLGTWDAPSNTLTLTPVNPWPLNEFIEVDVAQSAQSSIGLSITSPVMLVFDTIFQNNGLQVFSDVPPPHGYVGPPVPRTLLYVSSAALPGGYVVVGTAPLTQPDYADPNIIQAANAKIMDVYGAVANPILIREINAYDMNRNRTQLTGDATMTVGYNDDRGFVAGTNPKVNAKRLAIWQLIEPRSLWVRLPSTVDTVAHTVTATLPHFSVYAVAGTADNEVDTVYAFPIPWKPMAGNATRYGTLGEGVQFNGFQGDTTVRIYTISGSLVQELSYPRDLFACTGTNLLTPGECVHWLGTNQAGEKVASGVYLWEARSGSNHKTGKLLVVW